jgi:TolB-like protein
VFRFFPAGGQRLHAVLVASTIANYGFERQVVIRECDLSLIYSAMTKLREALGNSSENPSFVETLSRRGYRFIVPVDGVCTGSKTRTSIAVLPFVFLSDVEERRSLSLGFADALITMLGNLQDVAVLPTLAILNYSGGTDLGRVCSDLRVRHILQGNIQRLGPQRWVSIELFDGVAQKIVFGDKYDYTMDKHL